jgi:membrane protein YqaA with SNARE-associated domain
LEESQEQRPIAGSWLEWLYFKIIASCKHKSAPWIMGLLSFTESFCFIIPPEVMMLPMSYANRKKAFYYAAIATVTSVLGAICGYYVGSMLWAQVQPYLFEWIPGFAKNFDKVGQLYQENAVGALFVAAFTPIPFKVFTVTAGVYSAQVSIMTLIGTAIVGRGARYSIMCGIVYFFGEKAQEIIEKHFKYATIGVMVLAIAAFAFLKLRH